MTNRFALATAVAAPALAFALTSPSLAQQAQTQAPQTQTQAQPAQPAPARGQVAITVAGKAVSIEYGRPMLKGRDMLGQAEVGKPWRMGSNAPTTLRTGVDLAFGETVVPAGEYVLRATKVADGRWQLNILPRPAAAAGAMGGMAPEDAAKQPKSVADVPLTLQKLPQSVEQFTIALETQGTSGEFRMSWGTTALFATFRAR